VLFVEGDPSESFYVILTGRVAMVEGYGTSAARWRSGSGPASASSTNT
jgi:hypothetical protein